MTTQPGERPIDKVHEAHRLSPTYGAIEEEAYGEDYARGVNPCGPTSSTDLRTTATALRLDSRDRLLDAGCGQGGPGLWLAHETILKSARYYLGLEDGIDYLAASQWILVVARKPKVDD